MRKRSKGSALKTQLVMPIMNVSVSFGPDLVRIFYYPRSPEVLEIH